MAPAVLLTGMPSFRLAILLLAIPLLASINPAGALTLAELQQDEHLTPDRFARYFRDFRFRLGDEVQAPEAFLGDEAGDCDDYATLAAEVLKKKGYTPQLVVVFMEKEIHAVCFIRETKSYLDYNNRRGPLFTVPSDGSLADIARQVAASFHQHWSSVAEFTYRHGRCEIGYIDFPQPETHLAVSR